MARLTAALINKGGGDGSITRGRGLTKGRGVTEKGFNPWDNYNCLIVLKYYRKCQQRFVEIKLRETE